MNRRQEQARRDYIPKGENLAYFQSLPVRVPRCYKEHEKKLAKESDFETEEAESQR